MDAREGFRRSFEADKGYSSRFRQTALEEILLSRIPGATGVRLASRADDYRGTDYWVERLYSDAYSIDLKLREKDYGDLTLEIWSKMPTDTETGQIGWTRNARLDTDYVLWAWADTGRFSIMPFAPLWSVFTKNWEEWLRLSRVRGSGIKAWVSGSKGDNGSTWQSQCLFVREDIVEARIDKWCHGYVTRNGN